MEKKEILVGYSRKNITPEMPTGLGGYGNDSRRLHEKVLDPVYGICLALTDSKDQTVLLYSVDLLLTSSELTEKLRSRVSEATGVPSEQILLAATHNHSGPSMGDWDVPWAAAFYELFLEQMTQAAQDALADRAAAVLETGNVQADNMNYTRHYINDDGTYFGDNFGTRGQTIAGHAGTPDRQIRLIRFARAGKQDILLMNWQAHAKMCSTATSDFGKAHHKHLSADFIGYTRKHLEELTGAAVIYFSGASGNLNPDSRIPEEAPPKEPDIYGNLLANIAAEGLKNTEKLRAGDIFCKWKKVEVPIDHSDDTKIDVAREIWSHWSNDPQKCKELAKENGFNSAYAARDVIRRYDCEESRQMELGVVTVGDMAFVAVPYEMFCDNGRYIKENSPYPVTVILSCTNEYHKYIPSDFAFCHGCYEVDSRLYPRGTAEKLADTIVEMLEE